MGDVIELKRRMQQPYPSILEFVWAEQDVLELPPDGPISPANLMADLYLLEVARFIRNRGLTHMEAAAFLKRKVDQIFNQQHFGLKEDAAVVDRLGQWFKELSE